MDHPGEIFRQEDVARLCRACRRGTRLRPCGGSRICERVGEEIVGLVVHADVVGRGGGQSREGEAEAVPGRDAEDVRGIPADEEILAFGVAVKFHVVDLCTAVDTRLAVRTGPFDREGRGGRQHFRHDDPGLYRGYVRLLRHDGGVVRIVVGVVVAARLDLRVVLGAGLQFLEQVRGRGDALRYRGVLLLGAVGPPCHRIGSRPGHFVPFEGQLVGIDGFGVEFHVRRNGEFLQPGLTVVNHDDVVEQVAGLVGARLCGVRGKCDARRGREAVERHREGFEPAYGRRDVHDLRSHNRALLAHDVVRAELGALDGLDHDVAAIDVFAFGIGAGRETHRYGRVLGQGRQLGRIEDADTAATAAALDVARTGRGVARRPPAFHADAFDVLGRRASGEYVELRRPVADRTVAVGLRVLARGGFPRLAELGTRYGVVTCRRADDVAAVDECREILRQHDISGLCRVILRGFGPGLGRGPGDDGGHDVAEAGIGDPGVVGRFGIEPREGEPHDGITRQGGEDAFVRREFSVGQPADMQFAARLVTEQFDVVEARGVGRRIFGIRPLVGERRPRRGIERELRVEFEDTHRGHQHGRLLVCRDVYPVRSGGVGVVGPDAAVVYPVGRQVGEFMVVDCVRGLAERFADGVHIPVDELYGVRCRAADEIPADRKRRGPVFEQFHVLRGLGLVGPRYFHAVVLAGRQRDCGR